MSIGEICNREVIVCRPDESIQAAARLMRNHHVGDVVVVEGRGSERIPVGILTDRDIVIELLAEEVDLNAISVADVMSCMPITAQEDDDLLTTLEYMRDKGVRRIPIVNQEGGLEGILAVDDIIELVAEQLTDLVRLISRESRHERQTR